MRAVIEAGKAAPSIRLVQDAFNTVSMPLYADLGFDYVLNSRQKRLLLNKKVKKRIRFIIGLFYESASKPARSTSILRFSKD